jgi:hypothetical protein
MTVPADRAKKVQRLLIASSASASLLITNARTADMAPRPLIVDPGYDWTGFLVGLNGGRGWGRSNSTVPALASASFRPRARFHDHIVRVGID